MTIQAKPHRATHQRVQQSVQHVQPQPQKQPPSAGEALMPLLSIPVLLLVVWMVKRIRKELLTSRGKYWAQGVAQARREETQ